jgi:predicted transcriptional regulator
VDHREQIVLQSARNALPNSVNIAAYRFRHIADRLVRRGYLEVTATSPESANYALTSVGAVKLNALRGPNFTAPVPAIAAE